MTEDRELLEAAAKAAGMNVLPDGRWPADAKGWFYNPHGQGGMFSSETPLRWNPLTDDGDALRLAVKLRLSLFWDDGKVVARARIDAGLGIVETTTPIGPLDEHAAARWSIVNCAAAIGKDKP